ncbi:ABC transporter ATP-binding protein [Shimwellia pseudoproteus]|uniref:ABC transporter ATP-binding protein n=1 Tax=Shimwellia pseudoproteus TaxID=570012 RepID=UPI0018EA5421|nr:ABC transporter ATP-binding protein [Shimwellia pseudoproteus]MBJ3813672.1 ABC transporter ATP-binding protein [Shimwellia pseudoproteus]
MDAIVLDQVSVHFPASATPALAGVDLRVRRGECLLLTGRCGCGKSTLLRLVNGVIPHVQPADCRGTVLVNGITPADHPLEITGRRVSTVYQNPRQQFFCADPLAELAFGSENAGDDPGHIMARAITVARALGIAHLLARNMFTLSGGELQRIAIAAAMMDSPAILLLDEPASSLDAGNIASLAGLLRDLRDAGMTILIAEHRLGYLRDIVSRVIRLEQGRIVEDLPAGHFWLRDDATRIAQGLRTLSAPLSTLPPAPPQGDDGILYRHRQWGTLHFPRSAVTVLAGASGAGKSTLAREIAGLVSCREPILVDGKPLSARQRLRRSFLVLQDVNRQLFAASVAQELQIGAGSDAATRQRVVSQLALEPLLDRHPQALSGGQQQRVAVALALIAQRDLLIFDEPTSGLDYAGLCLVAEQLASLASRGAVVVLITHDPELIAHCAHFQLTLPHNTLPP